MHRPPWSPVHHEGPPPRGRPRLRATRRSHADARLRRDARGRDGGVREELVAGAVLRSGSPFSGANRKTFADSELLGYFLRNGPPAAMGFQSGMILPTSLFEAFKHPLISPITRFFVS